MSDQEKFKQEFAKSPLYKITVPSRVNLIGEHSDYYDNFVLPMAISNVGMVSYIRPREDDKIRMHSMNLGTLDEPYVEISTQAARSKLQWVQYVQGAIAMYAEEYTRKALKGFDIYLSSSIPIGGGLSSSSALTMTSLAALGLANGFTDGDKKLPLKTAIKYINQKGNQGSIAKFLNKLCMMGCWSEYWYGTRGGAMDHFAITVSRSGSATLLDNRTFEYKYIPVPSDLSIIICNTMVRHNQLYTEYGERKKTAMSGFAKIHRHHNDLINIRDISLQMLNRYLRDLTDEEYKKMKHPITEKERVFKFVESIKDNKYQVLGETINEAFLSLKDDYDVSCMELNIMQKAAIKSVGCFGARITGGGFGGCIVAFVDSSKKEAFMKEVKNQYDNDPKIKKLKISSEVWEANSGDGLKIDVL